jgi:hypothetical protein
MSLGRPAGFPEQDWLPVLSAEVSRPSTDRLSLDECRRLIGPERSLEDDAILALREQLYVLAGVAVRGHLSATRSWGALEESQRIDADERAAILQFDGGVPKPEADRIALTHSRRHRRQ